MHPLNALNALMRKHPKSQFAVTEKHVLEYAADISPIKLQIFQE